MNRIAVAFTLGLLLCQMRAPQAQAADAAVISMPTRVERLRVRHIRVVERRPYYAGCPDGLSCYPLYGAYGPYGGQAYWSAYSGW